MNQKNEEEKLGHLIDEAMEKALKEEVKPSKKKKSCCQHCDCHCYDNYSPVLGKREYFELLNEVIDPETGIGIVDMGLIYDVEEDREQMVCVTMTFTSTACPLAPQIRMEVDKTLRLQEHVKDVSIDVVWEPAWTPEMMNPDIRIMLYGN